MSLSTKLTLIFSAIILLMGSISFYGIYHFQNDILEHEITEKLKNVAVAHLDRLDRMLFERLEDLDVLSTGSVIPFRNSTPEQINRALEKFLNRHPQYASVSFFDMNRMKIASVGSSKLVGQQHSLSEYWPAVYAGQDHIINVSVSESLRMPTVHIVDRVTDSEGNTLGILVARIPVEDLFEWVDEKRIAYSSYGNYKVDLLDQNGLILYSNHNKAAILNAVDDDFELLKNALPSVQSVGSQTHIHQPAHGAAYDELMIFAKEQGYRNFKGYNWILKIEYAGESAFAPVVDLSKQVFILLWIISLLGIATILSVLLFKVVRPINKLNNATNRVGKGKLDTRVKIESSDEIGKLARSFNEMASNLNDARTQLAHVAKTALTRANRAEREIINISEETQQRIGRELHDDLGQQLTGIAFMSEVLGQHLKSQSHPDAITALKITTLVNEAIAKTHKLAHGLYPVELKESGLCAMLMNLAGNTESIYQTQCEFICEGESRIDAPLPITNLFRIAQEAVHNAIKYSNATKITVKLISTPDTTTIEISDNGIGIGNLAEVTAQGGMGMHTMQYRASLLGATFNIKGLSGVGTCVTVSLPTNNIHQEMSVNQT